MFKFQNQFSSILILLKNWFSSKINLKKPILTNWSAFDGIFIIFSVLFFCIYSHLDKYIPTCKRVTSPAQMSTNWEVMMSRPLFHIIFHANESLMGSSSSGRKFMPAEKLPIKTFHMPNILLSWKGKLQQNIRIYSLNYTKIHQKRETLSTFSGCYQTNVTTRLNNTSHVSGAIN